MDHSTSPQVSKKNIPQPPEVVERFRTDINQSGRGRIIDVAEITGIPLKTLRNLYYGRVAALRYDAMKTLEDYYRRRPQATH